jgi:hypothetical protein
MSLNIINIFIALATVTEIGVLCTAGFILFHRWALHLQKGPLIR